MPLPAATPVSSPCAQLLQIETWRFLTCDRTLTRWVSWQNGSACSCHRLYLTGLFSSSLSLPFLFSLKGDALLDAGESMKRLAEVKDSLDIEVKQNFIDPLQNLCDKDLKEIQVNAMVLSLLFISLDSGLFWLSVHVTTCSVTVGNNVDLHRYHFCSPARNVHSLSRFASISFPAQCIQNHCRCS